jgi:ribosomal protein S12 methylthiotransferase
MLGDLVRQGFSVTDDHEEADAVIVNTCAFVEDAKAESIEAIIEAASLNEDGKRRRVVVTGCLAQRYSDSLAADLPEADLVVGFQVGFEGLEGRR